MNSTILLIFSITLVIAVVISAHTRRSILSTAVLFLLAGFLTEREMLGWIEVDESGALVERLATMTLFVVLYTDGMRTGIRDLATAWHLPGRALILGMPIVAFGNAALAHWLVGFDWISALLIGTALAPTDPVFASAIVGRERVPWQLRRLLNVESGMNDGLALPIVVALLAVASKEPPHVGMLLAEVAAGVIVGIVVAYLTLKIESTRLFGVSLKDQSLAVFAIGLLVYAIAEASRTAGFPINEFLAAFSAGITVTSVNPEMRDTFQEFGDLIADVFKFAALLVLGALITPGFISEASLAEWIFVAGALLLIRPLALITALLGSKLPWRQRLVAAWFGPKGFASVVYAILILQSDLVEKNAVFHLAAITVAVSIIAHSSTDVLVARWFSQEESTSPVTDPAPSQEEIHSERTLQ